MTKICCSFSAFCFRYFINMTQKTFDLSNERYIEDVRNIMLADGGEDPMAIENLR